MKMLHPHPPHDLTYSDVFMVPSLSAVGSRLDVDLSTPDRIGTTIPLVVANMTAIAGRRMAEVVARRGGVAVMPQDIPVDVIESVIGWVKTRHSLFETPITLSASNTVGDALSLIHKRAHGAVIVIDSDGRPIGVFTEQDAIGFDRFTQLQHVMSSELDTLPADITPEAAFDRLHGERRTLAPVVDDDGRLLGLLTSTGALRSTIYRPALDEQGRLLVRRRGRDQRRSGRTIRRSRSHGSGRSRDRHGPRASDAHARGRRVGPHGLPRHVHRRRQRRDRRRDAPADRGRRRHRQGGCRAWCHVHDPDDDRGRSPPVLGRRRMLRRGSAPRRPHLGRRWRSVPPRCCPRLGSGSSERDGRFLAGRHPRVGGRHRCAIPTAGCTRRASAWRRTGR